MSITQQELFQTGINHLTQNPNTAARVALQDPTILQQLGANAAMLAMLSRQIEFNANEAIEKTRDGAIYAAAAARGILPLAKPTRSVLTVLNTHPSQSISVLQGRELIDSKGNRCQALGAAIIPAGQAQDIEVLQFERRTITNTVASSVPFYEINISGSQPNKYIFTIRVFDSLDDEYQYKRDFANLSEGEKVYHVEVDAQRRMYVRLGAKDATGRMIYGYQPDVGEVYTVEIDECAGFVDLEIGAPFILAQVNSEAESKAQIRLKTILSDGSNPVSIDMLRLLVRYPSLSPTETQTYFNDYDYGFRKYLSNDVFFMSVWNEQVEESVRGANLQNINRCFIAYVIDGLNDLQAQEYFSLSLQRQGSKLRPVFVPVVENTPTITITGKIPAIYDLASVEGQIRGHLLGVYGREKPLVSNGMFNVFDQTQAISKGLIEAVPALKDDLSNFDLSLTNINTNPEAYRYLTNASIIVELEPIARVGGTFWNPA